MVLVQTARCPEHGCAMVAMTIPCVLVTCDDFGREVSRVQQERDECTCICPCCEGNEELLFRGEPRGTA